MIGATIVLVILTAILIKMVVDVQKAKKKNEA